MIIRVYIWNKDLSKDWIREHGDNRPEESKADKYKEDSDDSEREAPATTDS